MAHINKQAVINDATAATRRLSFVVQDPAVLKAAKEAGQDFLQASRSSAALVGEVKNAWRRSA